MERVQSSKRQTTPAPVLSAPKVSSARREYLFAMAYLREPNATKAAIAIGLAPKSARIEGSKYLTKPNVAAILDGARKRYEERTNVTVEGLLKELGKVAFASMQDYWRIDDEGQPHIDLSQLTPEQWAAIGEITVEEFMDGPKGNEREVKRTKFKLHDKLGAIDKAMRHLGGYGSKGNGDDIQPGGDNITTYTLNIGNANIVVQKDGTMGPKVIEG